MEFKIFYKVKVSIKFKEDLWSLKMEFGNGVKKKVYGVLNRLKV